MEFIAEDIEVKTDDVAECDNRGYPILKNEDRQSNRNMDENTETIDPYFKFKLLVDELLEIFTKCEDKCGVCVEYIVKLCQHIGDIHDSAHDPESPSNSSDFVRHPSYSNSSCIPIQSMNSDDPSTSLNKTTAATSMNTPETGRYTGKNTPQNICAKPCGSSVHSKTRSTVQKNNAQRSKSDLRSRFNKKWSCRTCGKNFLYPYRLKRHLLTHTGEKPFQCTTCGKCFTRDTTLRDHNRIHTGEMPYKCNICNKLFRYKSGLRTHRGLVKCKRQISHNNKERKTSLGNRNVTINLHRCLKCGKMFRNRYALSAHGKVHSGNKTHRFYCGVCGKGFYYNYLLVKHRSTHTGEKGKKFRCGVCGKYFLYNSLLMRHRLTHSREKQFNCNVCGKSYFRKYDLDRHKLTHTRGRRGGGAAGV